MKLWPILLLAVLIPLVYSQTLFLPFVQDDYTYLEQFRAGDIGITNTHFFRPLATLYLYGMYRLFGENPFPFHLFALLIHFLTAYLVIKVVTFMSEEVLGIAAGYIYAFAGVIHIECFLWASGIHDLGCMLFFMLSMYLFLRRRVWLGAGIYLVACLFKEQAIVLPFILLFLNYRKVRPYFIAFAVLIILRSFGSSPLALPASHPYHVSLFGWHILDNLISYLVWLSQSFNPLGFLPFVVFAISGLAFAEHPVSRVPMVWFVFALLPLLFLPNHTYRYYAMYALPALLIMTLGGFGALLDMAGVSYRKSLITLTVIIVLFSVWHIHSVLSGVPISGGTNNLIQKIERGR